MAERTILVTGLTDGIGETAACELSRQGHRVLLHGRNQEKGRKVLAELEAAVVPRSRCRNGSGIWGAALPGRGGGPTRKHMHDEG